MEVFAIEDVFINALILKNLGGQEYLGGDLIE